MSILRKVANLASTATLTRGEQDVAMWRKWKASRSDSDLSALLEQTAPLINREVNKWSGTLARPLLETEGKRLAVEAFNSYDPNKGAALATHVVNVLQKMSRTSYANQNIARLPENKMLMYHSYHIAHSTLQDQFGRAPTTDELADQLGWSIPHLTRFRREIGRQEKLESGGTTDAPVGLHESDAHDHTVDFIHHGLPPVQKAIFEHRTGYAGAEQLTDAQIMKKLKLTQGSYSYQKRKLLDHIETIQAGRR